jgi:ankyrin repeat protein
MQVLGLAWAGARASLIRELTQRLIAEQRRDGGWAQIPMRPSDAYATGKTLVVLQQAAGLSVTDPAFQRGIRYLLDTQLPDGSWHQSTRRKGPGLPYFETGFPHGENQFISYAGTAWATMALSIAIDPAATPLMRPSAPRVGTAAVLESAADDRVTPLMEAALSGTGADLQRLLDKGADVNARSKAGLTALMCAVHDPKMAALLIDRGADVKARTNSGVSPLILAAAYDGATETVKLLLDRGADVNSAANDGRTALFGAAAGGDTGKAGLLIERGARLDPTIKPIGATPLHYAVLLGDADMADFLLRHGADVNARLPRFGNTTSLMEASLAGFDEVVRVLIAHRADLTLRDDDGLMALMYAVLRDPGYTDVVETLLEAGADTTPVTPSGVTAMKLAKRYGYTHFTALLSAEPAR